MQCARTICTALLAVAASGPVYAQAGQPPVQQPPPQPAVLPPSTGSPPTANRRRLRCQNPANPLKLPFVCKGEKFDREETLTRSTAREDLENLGIMPTGSYYSAFQTNANGGNHQVWAFVGQLTTAVDFNFEKLASIHGLSLYFSNSWGTGSNLTAVINSLFPVSTNYAVGFFLGEIYLQQKLLNGNLTLAAGRLAGNYYFAGLPVFANYVSDGINPTPVSILTNILSFAGPPPGVQWGAQAIYDISPSVEVAAGVFNTNRNSANNANIFVLQQGNKGAMYLEQASYLRKQGPQDTAKPGEFTAGFFYNTNAFAVLPNGVTNTGVNYGVFLLGQQKVWEPRGGSPEGLTMWGAGTWSPKQIVSTMPWFAGAGISYQGLIPGRKQDVTSAGWWYGKTSQYLPGTTAAQMLELNYQWKPNRFVNIIPDFQYIWRPSGFPTPGAAVAGVQLVITL